jgi:hypothetical protein
MENSNLELRGPMLTHAELSARNENLTAQLEAAQNNAETYERERDAMRGQIDALLVPSMERYLKGAFADYMRDNSDAFMDLVKDNEYEIRDELDIQDIITESNIEEYQTNNDEIAEIVRDTIRDWVRDGTITTTILVNA